MADRAVCILMHTPVMPGFIPGIHVFSFCGKKDMDGRDEPGHDDS
jgi:hypothetical protein